MPRARTEAELDAIHFAYIVEGKRAIDVALEFSTSAEAVRTMACKHGWKRAPAIHLAHVIAHNLSTAKPKPVKPSKAAPSPKFTPRDADLIAAFLASKQVTVLEPGTAAGLSNMERLLFACPPPRASWKESQQRGLAAMRARQGRVA